MNIKTCKTCTEATINADCHGFNDACDACAARHFAHSQMLFESRKAGKLTKSYKDALTARFGVDGLAAAHAAVKVWVGKIAEARKASKTVYRDC